MKVPAFAGLLLLSVSFSLAQDASHAQGWIVLPVREYAELRSKAFPAPPEPETPPLEATLTRVDYDLTVSGTLASGRAGLTIDVLKDGWVRIPVPAGLLVREARLDGKPLALVREPGGGKSGSQPAALLARTGRSVLSLDVVLPIVSTAGEERLVLPAVTSGVTRASIALPRQDLTLGVSGGLLAEKSESAAETRWLAYGHAGEPLAFTWRRKTEDHRFSLPLRLRGSLVELLGLGEDSSSVFAEVSLDVVQGAARQVRIHVPSVVTINQVLGATVADWQARNNDLVITFLDPVEKEARFVVTGETRLPREGSIEVPLLRLLDTERESGGVAVEVLGAGEILNLKSDGLERTEAAELGQTIAARQSPSLAAFRFRAGAGQSARALSLQVARYTQQAVLTANIEEARYRVLWSRDGKALVEARYAVRNNQRNFVKIALPQDAAVWSASVEGKPARPGQAPDGQLLLPLAKSRAGEEAPAFPVEVLYLAKGPAWEEKGRATLALPAVDLPVSRTGVLLFYSPAYRMTAEPGAFRTQEFEEPASPALAWPPPRQRGEPPQTAVTPPQLQGDSPQQQAATQQLVNAYNARPFASKASSVAPITVPWPAVGSWLFLVSELTSEGQTPQIELLYQREKKGGLK